MARIAKKERTLTVKEKLAQALVPDVEQPYRLPENWCWGYLTAAFAECKDSCRKPINSTERAERIGNIPYYGATGQVGWIDDYLTDEELVLLGEDGAPFLDLIKDKAYLISGKAWVNNHAHILKSFFGHAGNLYLLHYLNTFNYTGYVNGTTRLKLTQSSMDTIPVPIAPLAEQQRIVDRIESLFAKLDEAKEKAQAVVDGFEDRKAAILHKAFSGELTAEWRDTNHVDFATWKEMPLGNAITAVKDKYDPEKAHLLDVPYIGLEHFEKGTGIIGKGNATDVKSLKTLFLKGDILYGKLRPYLDKHDVAPFDGMCSTDILVYRAERNNSAYFFNYLMSQPNFIRYANSTAKGINLPRTSEKEISAYKIKLPLPEEQERIVQIVDALLGAEKQSKEAAEQVIDQIDSMKKSILARAFRGELGTNDSNDESTVELLKRVLTEEV